jgi:hypothetical protein
MTTLLLLLLGSVALVGYLTFLARFIHNDGQGTRAASDLPRSHRPDVFELRTLR